MSRRPERARLLPPGSEERWVEVSSGSLRVLHAGAAHPGLDPVVLIHGGGSDNAAISWFRLLGPLGAEREVWAIDLPGFGGSIDAPPAGGPVALAAVVAEACAALRVGRAVVAGVSMGGDVALNLALEHPALVSGLITVAPGGLAARVRDERTHHWAWLGTRLPDWLLVPMARVANRFVGAALKAMVNDVATLPPEVVAEFAAEAQHPLGGLAYGRYNQATVGRDGMLNDVSARLGEIAVPTLLLHGADDPLVSPDDSRRAASLIPDARLVLLADCGHWAQLEAHDAVLDEIRAHLGRTGRG